MSARIQLNWFDDKLAARAAAIAAGQIAPAAPRDASTVVVIRSAPTPGSPVGAPPGGDGGTGSPRGGNGGASSPPMSRGGLGGIVPPEGTPIVPPEAIQILMLKRPAAMKFAAGAYVFPGGRVDEADSDPRIGWHGPAPEEFGAKLGASPETARALVVAAVRETYEESGVLLAGNPDGGTVIPSGQDWDSDRAALRGGELSFPDLLAKHGLVILADRIVPWARWITPAPEPRRYDTRFFAAILPPGQTVDGHLAEADSIAWTAPREALDAARAGEIMLLPPTATTLNEFAAADGDITGFLGQPREIALIEPRILVDDGRAWLEVPEGVAYPL